MIGAPKHIRDQAHKVVLAISIPLAYIGISEGQGTYNSLRWKTKKESYEERRIHDLRQQFQNLDLNKDGVIDSTEFIYQGERK